MKTLTNMRVVGGDANEPHAGGVIKAFARIGYKLSEAVADIVDNAVDAGAKNVLVRFFCAENEIRRVAVVDDGGGMTAQGLLHSMQFGTDAKHAPSDLGKFGIGLKSASFSQSRCLSVLTMKAGTVSGRRWTVESIREGWRCERLHSDDCHDLLASDWGELRIKRHGTVVVWDELDRLKVSSGGLDASLRKIFKQLRLQLGIVYHRFLERGDIAIRLDTVLYGEPAGIAQPVLPIDPFGYSKSGNKHYPLTFPVQLDGNCLDIDAHIWPARSKGPEYSLGGSAAAKQGFYFYRNDRLIQVGGWNRLREHETDPHLSLARIAVDLPSSMDSLFHLDVQKASLDVPPEFDAAVKRSVAGGVTWVSYIKDAENAYRRSEKTAPKRQPIVLGGGVARGVQSRAKKILGQGEKQPRKVKMKWCRLAPDVFFDLDRENDTIKLNERFRKTVTSGRKAAADATVLKTLVFLLVRDEFERDRVPKSAKDWLEACNELLMAAVAELER